MRSEHAQEMAAIEAKVTALKGHFVSMSNADDSDELLIPIRQCLGSKQYTLIWFARAGICGHSHLLIARKPFTGTIRWGVTISTRAEENVLLIRQTGGL